MLIIPYFPHPASLLHIALSGQVVGLPQEHGCAGVSVPDGPDGALRQHSGLPPYWPGKGKRCTMVRVLNGLSCVVALI